MSQRARAVLGAMPVVGIVLLTIGGIYTGLFSPVEASAVGAGAVILYGAITRSLSLVVLWNAAVDAAATTATVLLILIAAHMILSLIHI